MEKPASGSPIVQGWEKPNTKQSAVLGCSLFGVLYIISAIGLITVGVYGIEEEGIAFALKTPLWIGGVLFLAGIITIGLALWGKNTFSGSMVLLVVSVAVIMLCFASMLLLELVEKRQILFRSLMNSSDQSAATDNDVQANTLWRSPYILFLIYLISNVIGLVSALVGFLYIYCILIAPVRREEWKIYQQAQYQAQNRDQGQGHYNQTSTKARNSLKKSGVRQEDGEEDEAEMEYHSEAQNELPETAWIYDSESVESIENLHVAPPSVNKAPRVRRKTLNKEVVEELQHNSVFMEHQYLTRPSPSPSPKEDVPPSPFPQKDIPQTSMHPHATIYPPTLPLHAPTPPPVIANNSSEGVMGHDKTDSPRDICFVKKNSPRNGGHNKNDSPQNNSPRNAGLDRDDSPKGDINLNRNDLKRSTARSLEHYPIPRKYSTKGAALRRSWKQVQRSEKQTTVQLHWNRDGSTFRRSASAEATNQEQMQGREDKEQSPVNLNHHETIFKHAMEPMQVGTQSKETEGRCSDVNQGQLMVELVRPPEEFDDIVPDASISGHQIDGSQSGFTSSQPHAHKEEALFFSNRDQTDFLERVIKVPVPMQRRPKQMGPNKTFRKCQGEEAGGGYNNIIQPHQHSMGQLDIQTNGKDHKETVDTRGYPLSTKSHPKPLRHCYSADDGSAQHLNHQIRPHRRLVPASRPTVSDVSSKQEVHMEVNLMQHSPRHIGAEGSATDVAPYDANKGQFTFEHQNQQMQSGDAAYVEGPIYMKEIDNAYASQGLACMESEGSTNQVSQQVTSGKPTGSFQDGSIPMEPPEHHNLTYNADCRPKIQQHQQRPPRSIDAQINPEQPLQHVSNPTWSESTRPPQKQQVSSDTTNHRPKVPQVQHHRPPRAIDTKTTPVPPHQDIIRTRSNRPMKPLQVRQKNVSAPAVLPKPSLRQQVGNTSNTPQLSRQASEDQEIHEGSKWKKPKMSREVAVEMETNAGNTWKNSQLVREEKEEGNNVGTASKASHLSTGVPEDQYNHIGSIWKKSRSSTDPGEGGSHGTNEMGASNRNNTGSTKKGASGSERIYPGRDEGQPKQEMEQSQQSCGSGGGGGDDDDQDVDHLQPRCTSAHPRNACTNRYIVASTRL